jgi:hypothetical protein
VPTELLPRADAANAVDATNPADVADAADVANPADAADVADAADATVTPGGLSLPFCPTTIDVYGGINMALMGCGGPTQGPSPLEGGFVNRHWSDSGFSEFANTMAGRLQARLVADPDLVPTFGSNWQVRSCAAPNETLPSLVPAMPDDACGSDAPPQMGTLSAICSAQPAPLLLLAAGALDDRCHGGGPDSSEPDDPTTFAAHFAARLDSLLVSRQPKMAIVGAQTEWYALESQGGPGPSSPGTPDRGQCQWQRPDWAETGLGLWQASHLATADVMVVGDLHNAFKQHSSCCQALGVTCATNWLAGNGPEQGTVNCDGAQALVDFWYTQLKALLRANQFQCP